MLHKTTYKISENHGYFFVFDYAKHKMPDGSYQIVIFEFQNIMDSQLDRTNNFLSKECAQILSKLFGPKVSFMDLAHFPRNTQLSLDTVLKQLRTAYDTIQELSIRKLIGTIYFHLVDYDLLDFYPDRPPAKCKADYVMNQISSNKVLQRLLLNSNTFNRKFLPGKVIISTMEELRSDTDALADIILACYGVSGEIFLKCKHGALGTQNKFIKIQDMESLKEDLFRFGVQNTYSDLLSIETASHLGESKEKKHVDNYRLVCYMAKNSKNENNFNAINLWRTISSGHNLDSHSGYTETLYFAESNPIHERYQLGDLFYTNINKDKFSKHLSLSLYKPALFEEFRKLCEGFASIDFAKALSKTPVYYKGIFDNKYKNRVVFTSNFARRKTVDDINNILSSINTKQSNTKFAELQEIKEQAEKLDDRNWGLIARAANTTLQQFIQSPDKITKCVKILKSLIVEPNKNAAELRAKTIMGIKLKPLKKVLLPRFMRQPFLGHYSIFRKTENSYKKKRKSLQSETNTKIKKARMER